MALGLDRLRPAAPLTACAGASLASLTGAWPRWTIDQNSDRTAIRITE